MPVNKALLVINPKSKRAQESRLLAENALNRQGIKLVKVFPESAEHMKAAIMQKAGAMDCVIIGGGDGTINSALEGLLETRVALGILPLGTANDLARTLGIPNDLEEAARIIAAGKSTRIDLGWINGRYFLNVANIGLAVRVKEALTFERKQRWGILAYPLAMLSAIRSIRPFKCVITCDGRTYAMRSVQIAVGNGKHYGGGMTIKADASIQDHKLDIYSLEPRRFLQFLLSFPALRTGEYRYTPNVWLMQGDNVHIRTRKPKRISTDGESAGYTPARFKVIPSALPVLVP